MRWRAKVFSGLLLCAVGMAALTGSCEAIPAYADEVRNFSPQTAYIQSFLAVPEFQKLLTNRGSDSHMRKDGALGRNVKTFSDVAAQRDALWLLMKALRDNNEQAAEASVRAVEYAFHYQNEAGYFECGLGVSPHKSINADVFFMQAFAQMYFLIEASAFKSTLLPRMQALLPRARLSANWLSQNTGEMVAQDAKTANRLTFDALAFILNGKLLNDESLTQTGMTFIDYALQTQREDGVFVEKGGFDSSYQAVTLLNLQIALLYLDAPPQRAKIYQAVQRGMVWLLTRTAPSGEVLTDGNTRTGRGQEKFFGKPKNVNYPEVALALLYWAETTHDAQITQIAQNVLRYAFCKGAKKGATCQAAGKRKKI